LTGKPLPLGVLCKPGRVELVNLVQGSLEPRLEESLRRWWEWLPRPKSWMVEWKQFKWLNVLFFKALAPQLEQQFEGLPENAAALDWLGICQGEKMMNHALFEQSMLEIACNFCPSPDQSDCAEWLDALLARVQLQDNKKEDCLHLAIDIEFGKLLPPSFEWPTPTSRQKESPEVKKSPDDVILFGRDVLRSSVGGKKTLAHLKSWNGSKYEAWQDGIDEKRKESNAGLRTRLLQPNALSSTASNSPMEHAAASSRDAASGQIEVVKKDTRTLLEPSLKRPYSSRAFRVTDFAGEGKPRPSSSYDYARAWDRPLSALRKGPAGLSALCALHARERPESAPLCQNPLSAAVRPHSAMQLRGFHVHGALKRDKIVGLPTGTRPSTSMGFGRQSLEQKGRTSRRPQTAMNKTRTSDPICASIRRLPDVSNEESVALKESCLVTAPTAEVQYLSKGPLDAVKGAGNLSPFSGSPKDSLRAFIRPTSSEISVRISHSPARVTIPSGRQGMDPAPSLSVRSVSPTFENSADPDIDTISGEAQQEPLGPVVSGTGVTQAAVNRAHNDCGGQPGVYLKTKGKVSRLVCVDDLPEDTLTGVQVIYGQGSDTPLPQTPSKSELRPVDEGPFMELCDLISVRKLWSAKTPDHVLGVAENGEAPSHVLELELEPPSPYESLYAPRRPTLSLRCDDRDESYSEIGGFERTGDRRASYTHEKAKIFKHPIIAPAYQWEPQPSSFSLLQQAVENEERWR
jgi:hypothetical protein